MTRKKIGVHRMVQRLLNNLPLRCKIKVKEFKITLPFLLPTNVLKQFHISQCDRKRKIKNMKCHELMCCLKRLLD